MGTYTPVVVTYDLDTVTTTRDLDISSVIDSISSSEPRCPITSTTLVGNNAYSLDLMNKKITVDVSVPFNSALTLKF